MTQPRTVLLADDSALIRHAVQLGLSATGWRVIIAESGIEAIELAENELPDAILLDVEMPGLDGPATLERLQAVEATRRIPVIFLTGRAEDADRHRLLALGSADVIAKPFDPMGLGDRVAETLGWSS
jgi:CheY-like chemotaxis protein